MNRGWFVLLAVAMSVFPLVASAEEEQTNTPGDTTELEAIREQSSQIESPLRASPEEFAEALQHIAAEGPMQDAGNESRAPSNQPMPRRWQDAQRPQHHPRAWSGSEAWQGYQPWPDGQQQQRDWGRPLATPSPQPPFATPAGAWRIHSQPPTEKRTLVRQVAFELDRLAHALETAGAYQESDEVRKTAQGLRESVREDPEPAKEDL